MNRNNTKNLYNAPSFYVHILSSFVILFSIIIFYNNRIIIMNNINVYMITVILFAILLTLHSMSHLGLEIAYNYNSLIN